MCERKKKFYSKEIFSKLFSDMINGPGAQGARSGSIITWLDDGPSFLSLITYGWPARPLLGSEKIQSILLKKKTIQRVRLVGRVEKDCKSNRRNRVFGIYNLFSSVTEPAFLRQSRNSTRGQFSKFGHTNAQRNEMKRDYMPYENPCHRDDWWAANISGFFLSKCSESVKSGTRVQTGVSRKSQAGLGICKAMHTDLRSAIKKWAPFTGTMSHFIYFSFSRSYFISNLPLSNG